MSPRKKSFLKNITSKYRLVVMNDSTLEEQLSFRLSRLNVYMFLSLASVVFAIVIISLIVFTPLKQYIPGYTGQGESVSLRRNSLLMARRVDSLENAVEKNYKYINNLKKIINNDYTLTEVPSMVDSSKNFDTINLDKITIADSINRSEYENRDSYTLNKTKIENPLSLFFFKPVDGFVTEKFSLAKEHFGIDIASVENASVKAVLDGVVILDDWTLETGYVIAIQHDNDLVSFYKHNSVLYKKTGNFVNAGDALGIVGNSGEQSTGPHLHFEIWQGGSPIDPQQYLNIN